MISLRRIQMFLLTYLLTMWCSTWWEFAITALKSSSSVSCTRCDTEGSRALYRLSLTPRRRNASSRGLSAEVAKPHQAWTVNHKKHVIRYSFITLRNVGRCLGERYYVTFALWHGPSVCCLSVYRMSVTLLHSTYGVALFGNIYAPFNSLWSRTICVKILGKNRYGSGDCAS